MKNLIFIALLFLASPTWSQTTVNGRVQTGTFAGKPATCNNGDQYNATDTSQVLICQSNAWVIQPTLSGANPWTGNETHSGVETFANINKTIYVDCVVYSCSPDIGIGINAAIAALPSSGGQIVLPLNGTYVLCTAVTNTKPIEIMSTWATVIQPCAGSTNMFVLGDQSQYYGLHIDTSGQASYSGLPVSTSVAQSVQRSAVVHTWIHNASGAISPCLTSASSSSSLYSELNVVVDFRCDSGTAADGVQLSASGTGFVNQWKFLAVTIYSAKYGFELDPGSGSTGGVNGNTVSGYTYEAFTGGTELAAVHISTPSGTSTASGNIFDPIILSDGGASTVTALIDGSTANTCGNSFTGLLTGSVIPGFTDNSSGCVSINQYSDMQTGNLSLPIVTAQQFNFSQSITGLNNKPFQWKDSVGTIHTHFILGSDNNLYIEGHPSVKVINFQPNPGTNSFIMTPGSMEGTSFVSDKGTACTNGELALSAGWGNTATVTGVLGTGQTCEWTITSNGTGTASNPAITDTLTNQLPAATTVCEMRMVGGTGTATLIDQTTLSATVPVFTFNGTPAGSSTTYKVVRRCGP